MIYPWDIARFRQALVQGLQPPVFEHFQFATVQLTPLPIDDVVRSCSGGSVAHMNGPTRIFGRPQLPSCLDGIASSQLSIPPSCTYMVPQARIIGLNAILDNQGRLFAPDACGDATSLTLVAKRNLSNAEGYVLRHQADDFTASFFTSRVEQHYHSTALFLGNNEINNYGSFLIRVVPQLLKAASAQLDFDCYIASDRSPWLREALDLLGLPSKPIYLVHEVCGDTFDKVIINSSSTIEGFYDPSTLSLIKAIIARKIENGAIKKKLFVSRRLSRTFLPQYRPLLNELEISILFENRGFEVVYPETLTLAQQIDIFSQAKVVAGASGSGMLNALFAPVGCKVIDVESFTVAVRQHAKVYDSTGKDYVFVFGEFDPSDDRDPSLRRWFVDLKLIDQAIRWSDLSEL